MKQEKSSCYWHDNPRVLKTLCRLPRRIRKMRKYSNLAEFVMHDLCGDQCFDIKKAAYIVDNPDFNCIQGVAGCTSKELFTRGDIWQAPDAFTDHMKCSNFNKSVRSIKRPSCCREQFRDKNMIKDIANELGMKNFTCCNVEMPHGNHGFFIYEHIIDNDEDHEMLLDGINILSFCPINRS
jgi:hypothetical protein